MVNQNEMVERVAKAIADACYDQLTEHYDMKCARAAIEAMREPTNAMHKAMCDAYNSPISIWHSGIKEALK